MAQVHAMARHRGDDGFSPDTPPTDHEHRRPPAPPHRHPAPGSMSPRMTDRRSCRRPSNARSRRSASPTAGAGGRSRRSSPSSMTHAGSSSRSAMPWTSSRATGIGRSERSLRCSAAACRRTVPTGDGIAPRGRGSSAAPTTRQLTANRPNSAGATRHYMIAAAYILGCLTDLSVAVQVEWRGVARKVFGRSRVDAQIAAIDGVVAGWRFAPDTRRALRGVTARAMLLHGCAAPRRTSRTRNSTTCAASPTSVPGGRGSW